MSTSGPTILSARHARTAAIGVLLATAVGFVLRVAAARGDWGLDEAYSLKLALGLRSIGDAFWGLAHDNNHPLNTATMALFGAGHSVWLYRLPSIVLGTASIPVAASLFWRRDPIAAVVAAALAAVALPMVDFGSEARGYAGLVLASLAAIAFWDRAVAAILSGAPWCASRTSRYGLAASALFGTLAHSGMVLTVAVLGLAALMRIGAERRQVGPTLAAMVRLFLPTALCLLPAVAAFGIAIHRQGGYTIGDVDPFALRKLEDGYGTMLGLMSGLPDTYPPLAAIVMVLVLVGLAAQRRLLNPSRMCLALSALIGLPVAVAVGRLPNVGYARYYVICGLVLLLLEAELAGRLWAYAGRCRTWVAIVVILVIGGSALTDFHQIRVGRASAAATLALMNQGGASSYAADRPAMAALLLGVATAPGPAPVPVAEADLCRTPPEWYLAIGVFDPRPDGTVTPALGCALTYRMQAPFASNTISGTQWTLYRRVS